MKLSSVFSCQISPGLKVLWGTRFKSELVMDNCIVVIYHKNIFKKLPVIYKQLAKLNSKTNLLVSVSNVPADEESYI